MEGVGREVRKVRIPLPVMTWLLFPAHLRRWDKTEIRGSGIRKKSWEPRI